MKHFHLLTLILITACGGMTDAEIAAVDDPPVTDDRPIVPPMTDDELQAYCMAIEPPTNLQAAVRFAQCLVERAKQDGGEQ